MVAPVNLSGVKNWFEGNGAYVAVGAATVVGGLALLGIKKIKDHRRCDEFVKKYCRPPSVNDVSRLCSNARLRLLISGHLEFLSFPQSDYSLEAGRESFERELQNMCFELLHPQEQFSTFEEALRFDRNANEQPFYRLYPPTTDEVKMMALMSLVVVMSAMGLAGMRSLIPNGTASGANLYFTPDVSSRDSVL